MKIKVIQSSVDMSNLCWLTVIMSSLKLVYKFSDAVKGGGGGGGRRKGVVERNSDSKAVVSSLIQINLALMRYQYAAS